MLAMIGRAGPMTRRVASSRRDDQHEAEDDVACGGHARARGDAFVVKHDVQRGDGGYDPEQVVEDRDPVHGEQDAQIPAP